MDFTDFVLAQLPRPPAQVLEVGCGEEGGVAPALDRAGYEVLAIDPHAPVGRLYRRTTLEELDAPPPRFDAVVAGRVLHHVRPLDPALDKLVRLAPLLVVDEFAWNRIDDAARAWYEEQHRLLLASGEDVPGPPDLAEWRARHRNLHPFETLRAAIDARYEERAFELCPYLSRWLGAEGAEATERHLIASGAIPAIGWRYAGVARTEVVRSSGDSR